jgi:hypothetical protein
MKITSLPMMPIMPIVAVPVVATAVPIAGTFQYHRSNARRPGSFRHEKSPVVFCR